MDDIKNIRVSEKANAVLERLVKEQQLFKDDITAAKFAFSYAVENDLTANASVNYNLGANSINKWDTGSFDPDGYMGLIIKVKYNQTECQFRLIQAIINIGLESMSNKLTDCGFIKISQFM